MASQAAFGTLGQVAMRERLASAEVAASMTGYEKFANQEKVQSVPTR